MWKFRQKKKEKNNFDSEKNSQISNDSLFVSTSRRLIGLTQPVNDSVESDFE